MKKLSNTSYTSALLFSKPKIEKIVFEVPESKQVKTDVGFVFGGISQEYRLQKALELYQNGLINKILLSVPIFLDNLSAVVATISQLFGI